VVLAIGAFAAFAPADKYQSTATVLVEPQVAGGQAVPVSLIDFLVPSYLARLDTTRFKVQASANLPPSIRRAPVSISSTSSPGTGIININVSSTQQDAVAPWAKAMAQNLIDTANGNFTTLTLLDNPVTPSKPYAPARLLILALSVVIALFAAVISVIIASSFRARGDGAAEIRERFGARVLAEIPNLSRALAATDPASLAVNRKAFDAIDALQSLRANLSFLLVDRAEPWLVVTSAAKREGKSFISVNLSWLLASLGEPTLLLDADGRRSTAHEMLGLSLSPGIGDLTESNLRSITQPTANENLVFVGPGIPDRHPAELASAYLPSLLEQVDDAGLTLVVDAPPMLGAAETTVYAAGCGAVLLVIDARRRAFDDVEQTIMALNDRKIEVLGVVINRVRRPRRSRSARAYAVRSDES
jgi:tyrosine-protein kinase Etk/Wzc